MKQAKKNPISDWPDPSRIHGLVAETMSALKAVHESMHREVSIVKEERERIDAQYLEIEQNQAKIMQIKNEVDTQRNEIASKVSELESMSQNLQVQESDIAARKNKLEEEESQHASIRDTLSTLQDQINRDKQEIAMQREELMERLGSTPRTTPKPEPVQVVEELEEPETESEMLSPKTAAPKPASSSDQFRKLRRDAKRKAIGA